MHHPGEGTADFHSRPQVGPGTTAGGSTAGPQRPAKEAHKSEVQPNPGGAVAPAPGADHTGAAKPETQHGSAPASSTPSRTGNEKGVGDRTIDPATHDPAKH
jgi:hypothetical protein